MNIEFDPVKNRTNINKRGVDFALAQHFDFASSIIWQDKRKDYGEHRYCAMGYVDDVLFVLVFVPKIDCIRVISLRKANSRERRKYEQKIRNKR